MPLRLLWPLPLLPRRGGLRAATARQLDQRAAATAGGDVGRWRVGATPARCRLPDAAGRRGWVGRLRAPGVASGCACRHGLGSGCWPARGTCRPRCQPTRATTTLRRSTSPPASGTTCRRHITARAKVASSSSVTCTSATARARAGISARSTSPTWRRSSTTSSPTPRGPTRCAGSCCSATSSTSGPTRRRCGRRRWRRSSPPTSRCSARRARCARRSRRSTAT